MPYLHYETDSGRAQMSNAIKGGKNASGLGTYNTRASMDEDLIAAYLRPSLQGHKKALQIRRTLDQYTYSTLDDTTSRDQDQVVFRYTRDHSSLNEPVILMVDQLWLWMINEGQKLCC